MSRNSPTCCCCGIKTGAKVLAAFFLIFSIWDIIDGIHNLIKGNGGTSKNILDAMYSEPWINLVFGILDLIFTCLALHGIRKNLHLFLLPLLIGTGLGLFGILILIIVLAAGWDFYQQFMLNDIISDSSDMEANMVQQWFEQNPAVLPGVFFGTLTFVLLLQVYFFSVFYRCFQYIKIENSREQRGTTFVQLQSPPETKMVATGPIYMAPTNQKEQLLENFDDKNPPAYVA